MKLEFRSVELNLAHTWSISRSRGTDHFKVVVVTLSDVDGIRGLGEAAPVARYKESPLTVESFLRRIDPVRLSFDDIRGSTNYLESLSSGDFAAKCAVNTALLDGAARRAELPLCDYLRIGFQENKHVTSFSIGIDTPESILSKTSAANAYPVIKMKVGACTDKANLKALREAAPSKILRVDANEAWSKKEEALEMIEWLARDRNIEFVEQPMPASATVEDWRWLKQRSPLPIFGDESFHDARDVETARECFHGVNVKLVKTGGITGAVEALTAARKAGLKTMLGCMIETSVLISAAAHLANLCDHLDLDGNLLVTNDPYLGVTAERGMLSFKHAVEKFGLRVSGR